MNEEISEIKGCDLCGELASSYRGCRFGKKDRRLCSKCLSQWRINHDMGKIPHIELFNRSNEDDNIENIINTVLEHTQIINSQVSVWNKSSDFDIFNKNELRKKLDKIISGDVNGKNKNVHSE